MRAGNDAMVMFLLLLYMLAERVPLDHRLEQIKMKRKDLLHTLSAAEEIQVWFSPTTQAYVATGALEFLRCCFLLRL
jgi:hypothetical protein